MDLKRIKIIRLIIRRRKLLSVLLISFCLLNLFFFFMLPPILKKTLEKKISKKINRAVTLDRLRINPYDFSVDARGLFIHEPGGRDVFFHSERIFLDINISSLFRLAPVVNEMKIVRPYLNVVRKDESLYNFSDLVTGKSSSGAPPRFLIGNITLEEGRVVFSDNPKAKRHIVRRMNISLPFVSNLPSLVNTYTAPAFSAEVNGTLFVLNGKTKPFSDSLETFFDIEIGRISLPRYMGYLPVAPNFRLVSADLEGRIRLSYVQPTKGNPSFSLEGALSLRDLLIEKLGRIKWLSAQGIDADISSFEIFSRKISLSRILINSPGILMSRDSVPENDVPAKKADRGKEDGSPQFLFSVDSFILSDGSVSFEDRLSYVPFDISVGSISLEAENISNHPGEKGRFLLAGESDAGETVSVEGELSLSPLFSGGTVKLGKLLVNRYSPYYGRRAAFRISGGRLSASGGYSYKFEERKNALSFSGISLSLRELKAEKEDGATFLEVPALDVRNSAVDIPGKRISIGKCVAEKVSARAAREKDGKMDFLPLFHQAGPGKEKVREKSGKGWVFSLEGFEIKEGFCRFTDRMPSNQADITAGQIGLGISDLRPGTDKRAGIELSALLGEKGKIKAKGHFVPAPFSSEISLNLVNVPIGMAQPYLEEKLNVILTDGLFSAGGNLSLSLPAGGKPRVSYAGDASLTGFRSVDKDYGEPFVNFAGLMFKDLQAVFNPVSFSVQEIFLDGFDVNAVVRKDKKINLLSAVKENSGKSGDRSIKEVSSVDASGKFYAGKIRVEGGSVSLLDRSVEPNFLARIEDLKGSVAGISSMESKPAEIEVESRIGGDATLSLRGSIRPMGKNFFLDLKVLLDSMDMVPITPYSGKYAGYAVRKGRILLDLDYRVDKRKLVSKNRFMFDQLTLGERVESPDATKLPVRFAIALLRDPSGRIELNVPVTGSLDDPKFRIGPVILQVFINLISKAAVSPFALLGVIFGGGEELSYLDFDPGKSVIPSGGVQKLDTLVKILKERPALNLDIEGGFDPSGDASALRKIFFERKVKLQKLKETTKKGMASVPVDDIVLTPEEYGHYLWLAYREEKFPRPRNVLGIVKELPVAEMEAAMLEHTEVDESQLRLLAMSRGESARKYLLDAGISPERIFLLEPQSPHSLKSAKSPAGASRVDFRLK